MDPFEALAKAAEANDVESARELLAQHPELRAKLNDPAPGLSFDGVVIDWATRWKNREMIDLLLENGADINARSGWWAGGFGVLDGCDPEFAPVLIERGATVDAHAAARLGMLDKLEEIVALNPDVVHARGGDGQTPLHFAKTPEIARFLLDHGADVNARDVDHESTPAQYMVRDRREVARFLIGQGATTDILMAAALGDLDLVKTHLERDPEAISTRVAEKWFPKRNPRAGGTIYNWTLGGNKTAHVVAREFGHEEIFRYLMDLSSEELKLVQACQLGDEATFNALIAAHPDLVQTLSDEDVRKLPEAAMSNNVAAVRLMLGAGWPVTARGEMGGTPLHIAAWLGNDEMVREILKFKPPVNIRGDEYNMTPLGWAFHGSLHGWRRDKGDFAETVELLLKAGSEAPAINDDLDASPAVREVLTRHAARGQ